MEDKVVFRAITPNKKQIQIDKWKFDLIKNEILKFCQVKEIEYYLRSCQTL